MPGLQHEYVIWTRMQAEGGEQLDKILHRKELERASGGGLFFWGVGNAPSRSIPAFVRSGIELDIIFSVMKSKPKIKDVNPENLCAWKNYIDVDGHTHAIPDHVLVTSRASGRDRHYALICRSNAPLVAGDGGMFDPAAFRNVGGGAGVGASQVTALLERHASDGPSDYRVAMRAQASGSYWVKLVDPVLLNEVACSAMRHDARDEHDWRDRLKFIRSQYMGL